MTAAIRATRYIGRSIGREGRREGGREGRDSGGRVPKEGGGREPKEVGGREGDWLKSQIQHIL